MCISTAQARTKREISHKHLAKRPLTGSLCKDLAKRPLMEILFRDLAKRPLTEILPTELLYLFFRVLVQTTCQKTSYRDLVQRPCEKRSGLVQRFILESLNTNLTLRSLTEIFYGDLFYRDLFKSLPMRPLLEILCRCLGQDTSYGDLVQGHCIEICRRDLAKRSLQ